MRRVVALSVASLLVVAGGVASGGVQSSRGPRVAPLAPVAESRDADASGTLRLRESGDRASLVVSLRRLEPRTTYTVREADDGALLGDVRTNRRGRARLRVAGTRRSARVDLRNVGAVEVVHGRTGEIVLTGDAAPRSDPSDATREGTSGIGYGYYPVSDIGAAMVEMHSVPDFGYESISIEFGISPPDRRASWFYSYLGDASFGDGLPLGVARASELAGRAFEIRDDAGNAVIAADLPELDPLDIPSRNGVQQRSARNTTGDPAGTASGEESTTGPRFTFHVAEGDGVMRYVADLTFLWGSELPDDPRGGDGGNDGTGNDGGGTDDGTGGGDEPTDPSDDGTPRGDNTAR